MYEKSNHFPSAVVVVGCGIFQRSPTLISFVCFLSRVCCCISALEYYCQVGCGEFSQLRKVCSSRVAVAWWSDISASRIRCAATATPHELPVINHHYHGETLQLKRNTMRFGHPSRT